MMQRERENSFEAAALPWLASLYQTAFRMVHDQDLAERAVEQAYLEAERSFRGLPGGSDVRVWLFTVLFRTLHQPGAWRRIKGWLTGSPKQPGDPNEILRALDAIPEILREVLLLADVEGFGKAEIQAILGIPTELVAERLAEARQRLRAGLPVGGPWAPVAKGLPWRSRMYRILGSILIFSAAVLVWTRMDRRERVLLSGNFHSVAHKGTGVARLVALPDGRRMLRLLDVKTYPAPDLEVCLLAAPDAEDNDTVLASRPVCLGNFNPKAGYVSYAVTAEVEVGRYRAVAIWSRIYRVNFTTAPLE